MSTGARLKLKHDGDMEGRTSPAAPNTELSTDYFTGIMPRRLFLVAFPLVLALFGGCVNYGVQTTKISLDRVPAPILKAMVHSEPASMIKSVEASYHRSTLVSYTVEFVQKDGSARFASFDSNGRRCNESNR